MKELSALITLLSGIVCCVGSWLLNVTHTIDDSVLFYMGECMVYAAAIFNVRLVVIKELKRLIESKKKDEN